jgi:hypothetical protein
MGLVMLFAGHSTLKSGMVLNTYRDRSTGHF